MTKTNTVHSNLELYKTIGKKIKEARTQMDRKITPISPTRKLPKRFVTQSELAKAINVTFQQIQKYEKASNRISIDKLLGVANYLKKPVGYFIPQIHNDIQFTIESVKVEEQPVGGN